MAAQEQTLTDADFAAPETSSPTALSDSDFQQPVEAKISQPPVPQANTYVEDKNVVVGHPADMSHDQVNDAVQTQIYGRPRFDWHTDALPLAEDTAKLLQNAVFGTGVNAFENFKPQLAGEVAKAAVRGVENIGTGVAGLLKWTGEALQHGEGTGITPEPEFVQNVGKSLAEYGQKAIDFIHARETNGFEAPDPELFRGSFTSNPSWTRLAASVAQGLPVLGAATAVTLATGNPIAGAGMIGLVGAGEQYDSSREEGSSVARASGAAAVSGIGNTVLMSLPMGKALEGFGEQGLKSTVKGAAEFAGISAAMTPFNNIVAKIGGDKSRQLWDGMTESILSGAISGGILGSINPGGAAHLDNLIQEAHNAGVSALDIDNARSMIADQMVKNPDVVQEAIKTEAAKTAAIEATRTQLDTTAQTPQNLESNQSAYQAAPDAIFPGAEVSSEPSIAEHPDYIKARNDAAAVVNKYAAERNIPATGELAKSLFQEMHDEMGKIMRAGATDRAAVIEQLKAKYPDMENEFMALQNMVYAEKDKYFTRNIIDKYGARRPKAGIDAENQQFLKDIGPEYETKIEEGSEPLEAVKNILNSHSIDLPEDQAKALMNELEIQRQKPTSSGVEGVQLPDAAIKKEARGLRSNDIEANQLSEIERFVLDNGGIRPYKGGVENEEYNQLPKRFQNKRTGRPLDTMAEEMSREGLIPEGSTGDDLNNILRGFGEGYKPPTIDSLRPEAEQIAKDKREGYARVQPGIKGDIRENTGQVDKSPTVSEATALKESFRAQARAAKESASMTKAEVMDSQEKLISLIEGSDLSLNDKAKFTRTIKNVQNQEQLKNALPYVEQRINRLIEDASQRDLRSQIEKELASTKIRKQSGKPVGKFTPEIQDILDQARQAAGLSKAEADQRINDNLARYPDSFPPPDVVAQNEILSNIGGLEEKNSGELSKILEAIKTAKGSGKAERALQVEARKSYIADSVQKITDEVTGGKGVDKAAATVGVVNADKRGSIMDTIKSGLRDGVYAWNDLMDVMSGKTKSRPTESYLERFASVLAPTLGEKRGIRENNEKISDLVEKSYGVDNAGALKQLKENGKTIDLGTFKNANDVEVHMVLTKDQAIKKYMELKDPSLDETFFHENGMAWTPEISEAVEKMLTPEDKKFADAQLEFYKDYLPSINEVYRKIYGTDLKSTENYSPVRRAGIDGSRADAFGEFLQDQNYRRSVSNGSLKSRVENINPLEFTGAADTLQNHIAEMEHFKNWSEKVRDLSAVFGDKGVKQAIVENYGRGMYRSIAEKIDQFARGGIESSKKMSSLDSIRVALTRSAVGLRPSIALKRFTAVLAYMEGTSPTEFTSGAIDFMMHPKESLAILNQSEFLRSRGGSIDRDIKDAISSEEYSAFRKHPGFLNSLMLNIRIGDRLAIGMGGWATYKKVLAETGSHEKALNAFTEATSRIEQSGDLADLNKFQTSGSVGKLFTMFLSQPNKYLRREFSAIRNGLNGRIPVSEAAKNFAIYHFLLPMTFQYVSDMFRFDPKKQARAAMMGSLNGLFIVHDMIEGLLDKALKLKDSGGELPISQTKDDLKKALFSVDIRHIHSKDVLKAADGLMSIGGKLTGIPLEQAKDMGMSLEDIYDGKYRKGIGGLLGWPAGTFKDEQQHNKL